MVEDKMETAKFTLIRTVIHNNLWKPEPKYLRFTSPRDRATGWSQEGLNFFVEQCKADEVARAGWRERYNEKEERPDYFNYREPTAEGGKEHNAEAKSIKDVVVPGKEVELNI
eukprot:10723678-Ditylum_brightwellii.AAC.1